MFTAQAVENHFESTRKVSLAMRDEKGRLFLRLRLQVFRWRYKGKGTTYERDDKGTLYVNPSSTTTKAFPSTAGKQHPYSVTIVPGTWSSWTPVSRMVGPGEIRTSSTRRLSCEAPTVQE